MDSPKSGEVRRGVDPLRRRIVVQLPLLAGVLASGMARAAPRQHRLQPALAATLGAWMEALVPGARQAGGADFVAAQLARPRDRACLTLRYLDWPGPYRAFYEQGIAALDAMAAARHARPFADLDAARRDALAADVASGRASDWSGPPAGLFYFVTRADAVDVVYGTVSGFARLGVPYRPHVAPPLAWPTAA
ncbi:hypothetical protein B9N43_04655 [Denitratisoma sp. DHT3]|nr:hypothetical protein B9N43_04655 [Denitratisoma sp. DHT3]